MLVKSPKYRKGISSSQVKLLELLFKFRFMSVPLLSQYLGKDKSTLYERLLVLGEQGYVRKAYDSSYRLPPRPATYSLAAQGINYLKNNNPDGRYSEAALQNMYKNRSASAMLVDHSLDVFKLCLRLRSLYLDTFDIFSKAEMTKYTAFVRPRPDIYLRKNNKKKDGRSIHYQLELIEAGTMTWLIRKRINAHQAWFDENNEEDWDFEDNYPTLLLVCGNVSTEKRVHRLVDEAMLDFALYTTTRERFELGKNDIWLQYWDEDELQFVGL